MALLFFFSRSVFGFKKGDSVVRVSEEDDEDGVIFYFCIYFIL